MKRITIIMCAAALLLIAGCAPAIAEEAPTARYDSAFLAVRDVDEPTVIQRIAADVEAAEAERQAAEEEAAAELETYYEEDHSWVESYEPSYSGDGFMQEGVREHDGRTETWYSSNQAYHYRTGEWEVDDEGYYRDAEGYYVVAASDVAEGETLETSKGTAKVYDSGCDDGVTDFYTAF